MDGLEFMEVLMKHWPMPIIVLSSIVDDHWDQALRALELGAIEVFAKPNPEDPVAFKAMLARLTDTLVWAARIDMNEIMQKKKIQSKPSPLRSPSLARAADKIIAIGASTGGAEALRSIIPLLPLTMPGILIVQHMPEHFTHSFAHRLDQMSQIEVKEAEDGDEVYPGRALLAPGDHHMRLKNKNGKYVVDIVKGPLVSRHRPSVDVLMQSVAETAGAEGVGVMLTGMGNDGAKGMLSMRERGARTIAQSEGTCVVFGMPREVLNNGGAETAVPLPDITSKLISLV
jgi:two-component system chemotaxis response regulator CheB